VAHVAHATTQRGVLFPPHLWPMRHALMRVGERFLDEILDEKRGGSRFASRVRMRKLTVLCVLSMSLTTACMSEASWPHRDRSGAPVSTWTYHAWEREAACREVGRAAEVAPDVMSPRQKLRARQCGYGEGRMWQYEPSSAPSGATPTPPPSYPTRPPSAPVPGGGDATSFR
jgi:hypothetical protein